MVKYMIEVTTKYKEGYGSRVYGWSRQPIFKDKKEALKKIDKIKHLYDEVTLITIDD